MGKSNLSFDKFKSGYLQYQKIRDKVLKAYYYLGVAILALMAILVTFAVVMRYFFDLSWLWLSEINVILFTFTTFWGMAVCIRKEEHVGIDVLYRKFSPRVKKIFTIVNYGIVFGVLIFLTFALTKYMSVVANQRSPGIVFANGDHLPMVYIYSVMPVTAYVSMFVTLDKIVEFIMRPAASFAKAADDENGEGVAE
ncbi:MAG: TRAP transporter small permease [Clostridiales bacterium]|nr:TRAP transporter small permease [Clostridiales bacterium]